MDITCTECINAKEKPYFKPTDCDLCGKLLWGIRKQGYMCQECNNSYHKACILGSSILETLSAKDEEEDGNIQTSENEDNTTKKNITPKCETQIPKSAVHDMRISDIAAYARLTRGTQRRGNKGLVFICIYFTVIITA